MRVFAIVASWIVGDVSMVHGFYASLVQELEQDMIAYRVLIFSMKTQ